MIGSRVSQYRDSKGNEILCLWFNDKVIRGMHKGHYGHPGPADDRLIGEESRSCLEYSRIVA